MLHRYRDASSKGGQKPLHGNDKVSNVNARKVGDAYSVIYLS